MAPSDPVHFQGTKQGAIGRSAPTPDLHLIYT
jgi:hypothetical protein